MAEDQASMADLTAEWTQGTSEGPPSADGHLFLKELHVVLHELRCLKAGQDKLSQDLLQGQRQLERALDSLRTSGTGAAEASQRLARAPAFGGFQSLRPPEKPPDAEVASESPGADEDSEYSYYAPEEDLPEDGELHHPAPSPGRKTGSSGGPCVCFADQPDEYVHPDTKDSDVSAEQIGVSKSNTLNLDVRAHWTAKLKVEEEIKKLNLAFVPMSSQDLRREAFGCSVLRRVVQHRFYDALTFFLILSNTAFIGVQVQYSANLVNDPLSPEVPDEEPEVFSALEDVFCIAFVAELAVRMGAHGRKFFSGSDWNWNSFDTIIVLVMLFEQVEKYLRLSDMPLSQVAALRMLRAVRVVRTVRMLHILKGFQGLRLLLHTVVIAFKSMVWTSLVVVMLLYIFGVCFTQGVVDFCAEQDCGGSTGKVLLHRFGGIGRSLLTLFQAMTNGLAWDDLYKSLHPLPTFYISLFIGYVAVAYFAVLNVVTGIFVETTLQVANQDRDEVIKSEMRSKEKYLQRVQDIFLEMDVDGSNSITVDEFKRALKDKRILAYLNSLKIDFTDIQTLFTLLDRDKNGSIDLEEFVRGCMRLKGDAKSLDIAKLHYQVEWLMHNIVVLLDDVAEVKHVVDASGRQQSAMRSQEDTRGSSTSGCMESQRASPMLVRETALCFSEASARSSQNSESPRSPRSSKRIQRLCSEASARSSRSGDSPRSPRSSKRIHSRLKGEYRFDADSEQVVELDRQLSIKSVCAL